MNPRTRRWPRVVAAALGPLLLATWSVTALLADRADPPPPHAGALPAPPGSESGQLTAVIVAGATGAESLDLLVPHELLASTGRFQVQVAAPRREPLPLFPGTPGRAGIDLLPHRTFAELDRELAGPPDLVVLPYVPDVHAPANRELVDWLRANVAGETTLLTICGGSLVAAQVGLLDGSRATTHRNLAAHVTDEHPEVRWEQGRRWVEDGHVTSSAGITAAFDATLRVVAALTDRRTAERAADRIGYPHRRFLDDPTFAVPVAGRSVRVANLLGRPDRVDLGVLLHDGVSEVELASVVDLYPRTLSNVVRPVGARPGVVTTRHGLHLRPRHVLGGRPAPDRLVVPGTPPADVSERVEAVAAAAGVPVAHVHRSPSFAVDAVLRDIARRDSRAAAELVATGIEYPLDAPGLPGPAWPFHLLLRHVIIAGAGALLVSVVARWRAHRGGTRT